MDSQVTVSVIPAAGRGTRMFPLTKAVPKELLPLVDQPVIMSVVNEAMRAGISRFVVVTNPNKPALKDFFSVDGAGGGCEVSFSSFDVRFVTQEQPEGLGHAVLQACDEVGDEPFVVQLPDDLYHEEDALLERMLGVHSVTGGCVVALLEVGETEMTSYSTTGISSSGLSSRDTGGYQVFRLHDIIEKPELEQIRSVYAIMGRYVLSPKIFGVLHDLPAGKNGEIQLTDALARMAQLPVEDGGGVWGVVSTGRHYDTGNIQGYLQAQLELSLEHPAYKSVLRRDLRIMGLSGERDT